MPDNEHDAAEAKPSDAQRPEAVKAEPEHGKRIAEEVARELGVEVEYVRLE